MKIKYADGTARNCSDSYDDIINCLNIDLPGGYVIYSGLVWNSDEESENDDGKNAVAELVTDDGERAEYFA